MCVCGGGGGGGAGVREARVSDFFTRSPNLKKNIVFFLFFQGGGGRWGWD